MSHFSEREELAPKAASMEEDVTELSKSEHEPEMMTVTVKEGPYTKATAAIAAITIVVTLAVAGPTGRHDARQFMAYPMGEFGQYLVERFKVPAQIVAPENAIHDSVGTVSTVAVATSSVMALPTVTRIAPDQSGLAKIVREAPSSTSPTAQLFSSCSLVRAQKMIGQLKEQASDLLGRQTPFIRLVTLAASTGCTGGRRFRVVVGPFDTRAQAVQFCNSYNSRQSQGSGLQCISEPLLATPDVRKAVSDNGKTFSERLFGSNE